MLPVLVSWNNFHIYSYPLCLGLAVGVIYYLGKNSTYKTFGDYHNYSIFFALMMFTGFLGAKLGFILETWDRFFFMQRDFWLGGGMVFYGGMAGVLLSAIGITRYTKIYSWDKLKSIIWTLPIGHAIGRLGCFLAGCCYGTEIHNHALLTRHPVQLYESGVLMFISFYLYKKCHTTNQAIWSYAFLYAIARFCLEFWRGDKGEQGIILSFSSSQFCSIIIIFVLILIYLVKKWRNNE